MFSEVKIIICADILCDKLFSSASKQQGVKIMKENQKYEFTGATENAAFKIIISLL